jgi:hypothetical protein
MFLRIVFFLLGFGMVVIGFVYVIIYMNLMSVGYTFKEYVNFIIRRYEMLYIVIGFIILNLSIFIKGGKNELYL